MVSILLPLQMMKHHDTRSHFTDISIYAGNQPPPKGMASAKEASWALLVALLPALAARALLLPRLN